MVRILGQSGAVNDFMIEMRRRGITIFKDFSEVLDFKNEWQRRIINYKKKKRDELLSEISKDKEFLKSLDLEGRILIRQESLLTEQKELPFKLKTLTESYQEDPQNSSLAKVITLTRARIEDLEQNFDEILKQPFTKEITLAKKLDARLDNIDYEVDIFCHDYIQDTFRVVNTIDSLMIFFAGAIGEFKTITQLKLLPDSYILVNNYNMEFLKPIFYPKEQEWIETVQIDHLVVGPSGIFILETKNWSEETITDPSKYSPIKQVQRANYALYSYLKMIFSSTKIPLRNILVMVGQQVVDEFAFVKILPPERLISHITYFESFFSSEDINYLLEVLTK